MSASVGEAIQICFLVGCAGSRSTLNLVITGIYRVKHKGNNTQGIFLDLLISKVFKKKIWFEKLGGVNLKTSNIQTNQLFSDKHRGSLKSQA